MGTTKWIGLRERYKAQRNEAWDLFKTEHEQYEILLAEHRECLTNLKQWRGRAESAENALKHITGCIANPLRLAPLEQTQLVAAVCKVIRVSDQFTEDTGLKHGDPLTDAVDEARNLLTKLGYQ